jgi:hypothetical protein
VHWNSNGLSGLKDENINAKHMQDWQDATEESVLHLECEVAKVLDF